MTIRLGSPCVEAEGLLSSSPEPEQLVPGDLAASRRGAGERGRRCHFPGARM